VGHDMTPETLRKLMESMLWDEEGVGPDVLAHADAWKADRKRLEEATTAIMWASAFLWEIGEKAASARLDAALAKEED